MVRTLDGDKEAVDIFRQMWDRNSILKYESVYAMYLDSRRQLKYYDRINIGNHKGSYFDVRTAVHHALNNDADYIILAHNHIVGGPQPSQTDMGITQLVVNLFKLIDLNLDDHIILTVDEHFSFKDAGLIDKFREAG